ncbi:hypothetical protein HNQ02_003767 [Flavobacterium sp. 7E]|nr:hypothetical protein [Flavobacterium sp. 7E]
MYKYNFEIQTLKNLQDINSPHTLIKFEFLATDLASAEKYMKSLVEHYDENRPFNPTFPRQTTSLIESIY